MNIHLNRNQWRGLLIMSFAGLAVVLLPEESFFNVLAGGLMAVGLSFVMKFLPLARKSS